MFISFNTKLRSVEQIGLCIVRQEVFHEDGIAQIGVEAAASELSIFSE